MIMYSYSTPDTPCNKEDGLIHANSQGVCRFHYQQQNHETPIIYGMKIHVILML